MATSKRIARWVTAASLALALATVSGPVWAQAFGINTHTFNGRYITAYHGFDSSITGTVSEPNPPAVPFSVSGTLFSDGNGNVIGFENIDFGAPGTGAAAACDITGTYTVATAHNGMRGLVTLNLVPSCATVTCTGTTTPSCSAGAFSPSSPTQWFCAISGASGKSIVCTEMGEAASGTTFQTPISAVTWDRAD
ncbi:MAG: hypothetical protein ACXWNN_04710 [Candidatus Binataceae bacterium]